MIAVSACLAGRACRYDGKANTVQALKEMVERGEAVADLRKCWADWASRAIRANARAARSARNPVRTVLPSTARAPKPRWR